MILNWGKRQTALMLGGSVTTYPSYFAIGSGTDAVVATQSELVHIEDKQAVTSIDSDTTYKVKWTGDWNSVEMSGLSLSEFGMTISGGITVGSMWSRTVIPNIIFDGTRELRIEETWEVF